MATITRTSDKDREQLRRGAMGADQGPTDEQQQGIRRGGYPIGAALDRLGHPQDPTDVTFPFLRLMRRDHMVSMGLHFIAMPIISSSWYYEADDQRAAAFADNLIRPIFGKLVLTILRFLWAGYSPAVKNFDVIQPSWKYLPGINQDPADVWTSPNVGALIYKPVTPLRPENAIPKWKNGNFDGIAYDNRYGGPGFFIINGNQKTDVDLLHSVWAVHDMEGEDGSPFGFPRIAHCAPVFHMYRYIWTLLGRAFENNADPGPVMRYPMEDAALVSAVDGTRISNVSTALRIGKRKRSGSTVAMPSDTYRDYQDKPTGVKKWDIEYPKADTNFTEIMKFLDWLETLKLRSLWLQEQGLIQGTGSTSNRNVAHEFGDQRDASQNVLMQQIGEFIDLIFLKPAFAMNMPEFEGTVRMKTLGFGKSSEDIVKQIIQLSGQQNVGSFHVDINRVLESNGLPMLGPEAIAEMNRQRQEAAAQSAVAPPPAVTPTQGRRALVTQTGFDRETGQPEMMYVQLEDPIVLESDGSVDFVSKLPRTDVFADAQVVNSTRSLRTETKGFLSWLYADFARYLGKQKSLDLAVVMQECELELMAEGEVLTEDNKVRRVVDKVIGGWRPRSDRLTQFRVRARSALGRVYDRTVGLQLSRVQSSATVSQRDKLAAEWLDSQGATMVSGVLDTTRGQLSELLSQGVRDGKVPTQIAQDIREHFDGFPDSRANAIARTEVSQAYNYATVQAGIGAGIQMGQILDGNEDKPCKDRNGKIKKLTDLLKERLAHPNCTLTIRLLPRATANLAVTRTELDGLYARYDEDTATILFDYDISPDDEARWLIALGDHLAEPAASQDSDQQRDKEPVVA